VSVLAIAFGLAAPAMAQTTGGDTPAPEANADIVVTARSASASIIGSHKPLLRYPQSVRVLEEDDLTPLNATRLQDALDYAGGVTRQNDFGGLWDKYAIRGFAGDENTGPDILINRFGSNLGYNPPVDSATIERVEVMKGASAALSGRGEPGGSINIVTKAPLDHAHAAASAMVGSWDQRRVTGDVGGPIADGLSVRLIGVAEDHDSFRDHVGGSRRLIAPSIAWTPAPGLRLLYQAEYMRNRSVLDRGVVGIAGNARAMDRITFLGEPADGRITQRILWQQASLFADLGSGIGLELGGSQRDGSLRGFGTMVDFGARGVQSDGRTAGRDRRYHDFAWNDLSLRAEVTGRLRLLGLEHDLRIGVDRVRHALDFRLDRARGTTTRRSCCCG
jgi:iron complex outermembrane receptor protein